MVESLLQFKIWEVNMTSRKAYFKIFQDRAGEWRWTLYAANHEPVATSEGYKQRASAETMASKLWRIAHDAVN